MLRVPIHAHNILPVSRNQSDSSQPSNLNDHPCHSAGSQVPVLLRMRCLRCDYDKILSLKEGLLPHCILSRSDETQRIDARTTQQRVLARRPIQDKTG
jgi:hypothetical protein